jgi:hypothetical protein
MKDDIWLTPVVGNFKATSRVKTTSPYVAKAILKQSDPLGSINHNTITRD